MTFRSRLCLYMYITTMYSHISYILLYSYIQYGVVVVVWWGGTTGFGGDWAGRRTDAKK